jgi:multimeric flavodoxin WrbA
MIDKFLEGVRSADESIETKVINIYNLNYTGCRSCFACKRIGST